MIEISFNFLYDPKKFHRVLSPICQNLTTANRLLHSMLVYLNHRNQNGNRKNGFFLKHRR